MSWAEVAKAEVALLRAEAEAAWGLEVEVAAQQGEVLRAFAERIFRSRKFSTLVNELASLLNTFVVATTLDEVARDYPDLDKTKYGYEVISREELLRDYIEVLLETTEDFPFTGELASSSTLRTAEAI